MVPEEVFPGIFRLEVDSRAVLATRNMTPGRKVYGEQLVDVEGVEYRIWNPYRSKLAAAVLKGLVESPLSIGDRVLYLGVASGTTCSHISDVVGPKGYIWGVDFAPRSLRDLVSNVAKYRQNISPILGDARDPASYSAEVQRVDVLYADVAQPAQAEIVVKNAEMYLRQGGRLAIAIKSRSVNVTRSPREVYSNQVGVLEGGGFSIGEMLELEPNDRKNYFRAANAPKQAKTKPIKLPVTINGQILPGDIDKFRFYAKKGQQLVIEAHARSLRPYLADAVPGWFQATIALYDFKGREIAFADDYRFDPDPVLLYKIPKDGEYDLKIHDAIYRGREDFVYRVSIGEQPFITQIFPLGAKEGTKMIITKQIKTNKFLIDEFTLKRSHFCLTY